MYVISTVTPTTSYPKIDGCTNRTLCVLRLPQDGTVACSVYDIRPDVELEWVYVSDDEESPLSFSSSSVTMQKDGGMFDVILTLQYHASDVSNKIFTFECKLSGPSANLFSFQKAKVDLIFETGE